MGSTVEPRGLRHRIEQGAAGEQLRIPLGRQWSTLAFLLFWLAIWTLGGTMAIGKLMQHFQSFLLVWLIAWAVGWLAAAIAIALQLAGAEIVRVADGELALSIGVGPLRRHWRYRAAEIRKLRGCAPAGDGGARYRLNSWPARPRTGAVTFDHGADTLYLATGVDEGEGRIIAAWLAQRLPRSATE